MEEIAGARNFAATQSVVQIYGTCEQCRTGTKTPTDRRRHDRAGVRARCAADGDRDRAQRPGVLHPRREPDQGRARPDGVPEARRRREASTSARWRSAMRELLAERSAARVAADVPVLQGRGERPVRRGRRAAARGRRTISRRCSSASSASAARTSSSSATASASKTPKASRSSWSSPTRSARISTC